MSKELVMQENCPGCLQEGRDNPLRNQLGVFGTYCYDEGAGQRRHFYNDMDELNAEIAKMRKPTKPAVKKAAAPRAKPVVVAPKAVVSETEPGQEEIAAAIEAAAVDAGMVTLNEIDCGRLAELLGQPITGAAELVGAVYCLRTNMSELSGEAERRTMGKRAPVSDVVIPQRADGGLAVQAYIPEPQAKQLADKAVFNGQTMSAYTQGLLEYHMDALFFPIDVERYPAPAIHDGVWVLINVPESYVGSMAERAANCGMTATEYIDSFIMHLVSLELFP